MVFSTCHLGLLRSRLPESKPIFSTSSPDVSFGCRIGSFSVILLGIGKNLCLLRIVHGVVGWKLIDLIPLKSSLPIPQPLIDIPPVVWHSFSIVNDGMEFRSDSYYSLGEPLHSSSYGLLARHLVYAVVVVRLALNRSEIVGRSEIPPSHGIGNFRVLLDKHSAVESFSKWSKAWGKIPLISTLKFLDMVMQDFIKQYRNLCLSAQDRIENYIHHYARHASLLDVVQDQGDL